MVVELVIAAAGGAAGLYWLRRYAKGMATFWRGHKQADEFERALRITREDMASPDPFRLATEHDHALVALLEAARPEQQALEACGFTVLGDIVVQASSTSIVRGFVDPARTTAAFLVVARTAPTTVRVQLSSYMLDEMFATTRRPFQVLAEPPSVHRQALDAKLPPATMLARHRAFAALDDETRTLQRIGSREELLAELVRFWRATVRWREAQSPDALLDADLRNLLGVHHARTGAYWARRLRDRLPTATLRPPCR